MSNRPDLVHLAAHWAEHPDGRGFAALADGLRKRGSAEEALEVATAGVARNPRFLPGHLVIARLKMDAGEFVAAEVALKEALRLDPAHPVVLEGLAEASEARGDLAAGRAWREALDAALPGADDTADADEPDTMLDAFMPDDDVNVDLPLSESLAALYERQGHLDRAHEAYAALATRSPGNASLVARRDAIAAQLAARRPLPFDARVSGGRPLGDWLASVAAAAPAPGAPAGYDAFFEAEPPPPEQSTDFEAFQSWLKGLPK